MHHGHACRGVCAQRHHHMVGRQKQKRSRVKKRFASAEPNGSVASIRSYGFAHVQCRVMCEASQNLSSFTLRLNRAPDARFWI